MSPHPHTLPIRHLPHRDYDGVLFMGLSRMQPSQWIETDAGLPHYLQHKQVQYATFPDRVFRASASSLPAQQELAQQLRQHLLADQPAHYALQAGQLCYTPTNLTLTDIDPAAPLWSASCWVADDLLLMEQSGGEYCLTAASLCSPTHWSLAEKFGQPMAAIHQPVPGLQQTLTPKIDRFFDHLKPEYPVVRFNWSLQAGSRLARYPEDRQEERDTVDADTPLFYRYERQSLCRLPDTGAIAFTVRVYLHPLQQLASIPGAMASLFTQVDKIQGDLAHYKNIPTLKLALDKYRLYAQDEANEEDVS